ncbi:MAG: diacylglycerol kinase [Armatimonadetes bacterium]|nr:diacylglycerol kinase [Armatimonadota bacterium]
MLQKSDNVRQKAIRTPEGRSGAIRRHPKRARDSVRHAANGIFSGFHSQRHLRIHFVLGALALVAGVVWGLSRAELLILVFAITLVIVFELLNTAVETIVDMVTTAYHPQAKLAKDIAAGAVLVASINAMIVGLLLFMDAERFRAVITTPPRSPHPMHALVAAFGLVVVLLMACKALGGRGRFMHGGVVSGHAALGFCLTTIILLAVPESPLVGALGIFLALLVSQSRVEAGVHSLREVLLGAALGVAVPVFVYKVLPFAVALVTRPLSGGVG